MQLIKQLAAVLLATMLCTAQAQTTQTVIDIPTRPGVTQRMIVLTPPAPKAAVVLMAGGHGGLQIDTNGSMKWGKGNFLVRTRQLWADQGLVVAVVDAPSDHQSPPYLQHFRQKPEHAADVKAVIAWLRETAKVPVWLVGTSRGTQSAAYVATELVGADGPDGIVLSSTILLDERGRSVPAMPLRQIKVPVLVVHHEQDGCRSCAFADMPSLMSQLERTPRHHMLAYTGGESEGDPCEARAHHGFNGIEAEVIQQSVAWMLAK